MGKTRKYLSQRKGHRGNAAAMWQRKKPKQYPTMSGSEEPTFSLDYGDYRVAEISDSSISSIISKLVSKHIGNVDNPDKKRQTINAFNKELCLQNRTMQNLNHLSKQINTYGSIISKLKKDLETNEFAQPSKIAVTSSYTMVSFEYTREKLLKKSKSNVEPVVVDNVNVSDAVNSVGVGDEVGSINAGDDVHSVNVCDKVNSANKSVSDNVNASNASYVNTSEDVDLVNASTYVNSVNKSVNNDVSPMNTSEDVNSVNPRDDVNPVDMSNNVDMIVYARDEAKVVNTKDKVSVIDRVSFLELNKPCSKSKRINKPCPKSKKRKIFCEIYNKNEENNLESNFKKMHRLIDNADLTFDGANNNTDLSALKTKKQYPPLFPPQQLYLNGLLSGDQPLALDLVIKSEGTKVSLIWNINQCNSLSAASIKSYELFICKETDKEPDSSMWKLEGEFKAVLLPMRCILNMNYKGFTYHFAVRAVDKHNRRGPCSIEKVTIL